MFEPAVRLKRLYSQLSADNQIAIAAAVGSEFAGTTRQHTRVDAVKCAESCGVTKAASIAFFALCVDDLQVATHTQHSAHWEILGDVYNTFSVYSSPITFKSKRCTPKPP